MTGWRRPCVTTRPIWNRASPSGKQLWTNGAEAETPDTRQATQLTDLQGLGPAFARRLAEVGIHTPLDLLYIFPKGYTDRTAVMEVVGLWLRVHRSKLRKNATVHIPQKC